MNSKKTSIRAITLVAVLALGLSACSNAESESAAPNPTSSVAGPPVWNEAQTEYLNAINGAELASSVFLSASNYIEIGNTVCNGLKQDMPLEEILSALATSGKENGLNEKQRNDFTLITSAAAVSFLCRDQIEKYKLNQ
jgi:ABC-type transport system substrate-binding protein